MNVLFCASEVFPFAKTGGLADVCGTLPLALEQLGISVTVALPRYQCIGPDRFGLKKLNKDVSTALLGRNTQVYFIENEKYFDRHGLYGDTSGDYPDNLDRFLFYCRQTLALLKELGHTIDIIHCHDWQSALIPVYLKTLLKKDPFYKKVKSLLTIHNLAFQGLFPGEEFPKLNLDGRLFGMDGFEFYGHVNLLKGGILFSDKVTTVSPQYARDIQTKEYGCGLDGVLRERHKSLTGILNGLDYDFWNPETDKYLQKNYSSRKPGDKYINKARLQRTCHLPVMEETPVFGFVARLSAQKGIDLLAEAMEEIFKLKVQLVILGEGDGRYHKLLKGLGKKYSEKISLHFAFDESLAHLIYAGSDFFLMPSHYEPCGLSQMIALRYGTIPLVFKTGGLADTIIPFDSPDARGNGIVFTHYDQKSFLRAMNQALNVYQEEKLLQKLIHRAFECNFSWDEAAKKYQQLYEQCLAN